MSDEPRPPRCWSCGYDLTGLKVEDRCPECGIAIWDSHPRTLAEAPRQPDAAAPLGLLSLPVICFGPLACIPGVLAVVLGIRTLARIREGSHPYSAAPAAWFGIMAGGLGTTLGAIIGLTMWGKYI